MKRKLIMVLMFALMSFSLFAAKSNKNEDVKVPNIVLQDQYGKKHNLEEYKGKVVVINFWATWCGYCVQELPEFEKVYKEFGSNKKDVEYLCHKMLLQEKLLGSSENHIGVYGYLRFLCTGNGIYRLAVDTYRCYRYASTAAIEVA